MPIYLADLSEERARIARELHDGIAQDLAAIGYSLDSEIGRSDTNPLSRTALREVRSQVSALTEKIRREIFQLRSTRDATPNRLLVAHLEELPLDFTLHGGLPEDEVGVALSKVLIELSRNAVEHGQAKEITIDIGEKKISFINDGTSQAPIRGEGFGLLGITERLSEIGWEFEVDATFNRVEIGEAR